MARSSKPKPQRPPPLTTPTVRPITLYSSFKVHAGERIACDRLFQFTVGSTGGSGDRMATEAETNLCRISFGNPVVVHRIRALCSHTHSSVMAALAESSVTVRFDPDRIYMDANLLDLVHNPRAVDGRLIAAERSISATVCGGVWHAPPQACIEDHVNAVAANLGAIALRLTRMQQDGAYDRKWFGHQIAMDSPIRELARARAHLDEIRSAMTADIPKALRIMILLDGYEQAETKP